MASPLSPGDQIEYGISVDGGGFWVKLSARTTIREEESPLLAYTRAQALVDHLLIEHAKQLKNDLKI